MRSEIEDLKTQNQNVDFAERFDKLESILNLQTEENKRLNQNISFLTGRVIQLERESTEANQYARRRQIEMWNLPADITKLEANSTKMKEECAAILSLTGEAVTTADIDIVHSLKKEGRLIMELTRRDLQSNILRKRKNLKEKKTSLAAKKCPKLSICESLCYEYKKLDYICRQLQKKELCEKTFFFNRKLHMVKDGVYFTISHVDDLHKKFGKDVIIAIANN